MQNKKEEKMKFFDKCTNLSSKYIIEVESFNTNL